MQDLDKSPKNTLHLPNFGIITIDSKKVYLGLKTRDIKRDFFDKDKYYK